MTDASRVFWLSFTDDTRPRGDQFLGVAVVEVTADEAMEAQRVVERFPQMAKPGAEWLGAATRKAWAMGCNPGGSILSFDITEVPDQQHIPRHRLLTRAELAQWGDVSHVVAQ